MAINMTRTEVGDTRTHINNPIRLGTMIDASSPSEDASVPEPMQTGLELRLAWGDRVVVARALAPVTTTDSARDVKVVVGSVTVVGNVEVKVMRLPDAGGIGLDVKGKLEKETEDGGVVEDACDSEEDLVAEGMKTEPLLVVYQFCWREGEDISSR